MVAVETSSPETHDGFGTPQIPHNQRVVTIRPAWQLADGLHSQGLPLLQLIWISLCENSPTHRAFVKYNQWQLFNIIAA